MTDLALFIFASNPVAFLTSSALPYSTFLSIVIRAAKQIYNMAKYKSKQANVSIHFGDKAGS